MEDVLVWVIFFYEATTGRGRGQCHPADQSLRAPGTGVSYSPVARI